MKQISILSALLVFLLFSCSESEKEELVKEYFSEIQTDHTEWKDAIETAIQDSLSIDELRGYYFFNNQRTPFERRDIRFVLRYFDISTSDSLFLEYTKLIDRKSSLVSAFYLNKEVKQVELLDMIEVEDEIIKVLTKIQKRIQ